jgi:uncharacterized protein (TIGR02246 family)
MRSPRRVVHVCCATLLLLAACRSAPDDARITSVSDVRAALDTSVAAWNRGDLAAHVAIYADSAVLLPATEGRGPAQARRTLERFFAVVAERPVLALDSLQLEALGDAHVLVRGQYVLHGGRVDDTPRRGWFTEVWAHTTQGWRIIHDHSS